MTVERTVSKVQGVSLDTNKRELQRLARNSVEYHFRDWQVEASDALIDEVGALLTESEEHRSSRLSTRSFRSQGWRFGIETGFCN